MSAQRLDAIKTLLKAGHLDEAWAALQDLQPGNAASAELWYLRSLAAGGLRNLEDAHASIDFAIAIDPRRPHFHLQSGRLAAARGEHDFAIAAFNAALALQPALTLARSGLGASLLAVGRADEARAAFRACLAVGAASPTVLFDLARLEFAAGRPDDALALARRATEGPDAKAEAYLLIGDILLKRHEMDNALAAYRAADRADPGSPRGAFAAAVLLREQGRWEESVSAFSDCRNRHPGCLRAALGAELSLPQVYSSVEHLEQCRRRYADGLHALSVLPASHFRKPAQALLQDISWTNFLLAYQGRNDLELQTTFGDLMWATVRDNAPQWLEAPRPRSGSRIRIGFASHFFHDCTAGRYFSPWVLGLDRELFEVFVYYTNTRVSPNTQRMMGQAAAFRHLPSASVLSVAERIRDDALDILVYPEVGMHPDTQALACLRLAPVQCAGWGHPTTTGLATIDWFISCSAMEPAGAQAHYRERLALLPGLGTAYARPEPPARASRRELGLPEDKTLYLVPQSAFKIHPDNDELVASILSADPKGIAVLFAADARPVIDALVRRVKPAFERRGLSTRERLLFLPAMEHDAFLAVNGHCDVMLDTLHWSGGNTALDALSAALPIVTLPGQMMRGRQTAAMLRLLGLGDLIADDAESYVAMALRMGTDEAWREHCRARIRAGLPRLFDDRQPLAALAGLFCSWADGRDLGGSDCTPAGQG